MTTGVPDRAPGGAPDPGIRQQNEDSVLVEDNLFAVADGMGGHKAGEVASALTVDLLKRRLGDTTSSLDDVLSAVVDANGEIFTAATANIDQQGMGTTLTGLFVVTASDRATATTSPAGIDRRRAATALRPHQRRRLAHLPAPSRPAAPGDDGPQLRPGARQHRH